MAAKFNDNSLFSILGWSTQAQQVAQTWLSAQELEHETELNVIYSALKDKKS